jgi:CHAD domain-containing protein
MLTQYQTAEGLAHILTLQRHAIDEENRRFVTKGDAEALHDLRVAMRRLHSLFVAFSPAFVPHANFPTLLRQLQKQTNHARDLEVTLSIMKNSPFQLPWLEQQWQDELVSEYARLRHVLPETWETIAVELNEPEQLLGDDLRDIRLGYLTAQLLMAKAKRLKKKRKRLCEKWDEKAAHLLRISGKQTRYLLEPFIGDIAIIHTAVTKLKSFQDLLGDYHDIVVLRQNLKRLRLNATTDQFIQLASAAKHLKQQRNTLRKRILRKYCNKQGKMIDNTLRKVSELLAEN